MSISSLRFLALSVVLLSFSVAGAQQIRPLPLITSPIDETQVVTLRGNVHPLAQPMFDLGAAPPDLPMNRMMLVLKRDPMQDHVVRKLLDDQQDKNSPNYHKWLTPAEYGAQFGAADQDLQLITGWLQTHGFQINRVSNGRNVIEFSGVEGQVEGAFHTQIHQYLVNGKQYWANVSDPQIPVALAPVVEGMVSLHNFPRKPMSEILGRYNGRTGQLTRSQPQFTTPFQGGTAYAVGPADFGTIYNVQSLWSAGTDGTGQKIAIVAQTDINIQDVRDFRNMFGLPVNDPRIIYNGPNPGIISDESESDIDVQWAGAIAPKATVDLVVSESTETAAGVDLSAIYIVDNNLAPVMSVSYGFCELGMGTAGNQFYNSLWQQAAAQGITVVVASGDNGAAGCDFFNGNYPQPAQYGLQVSGFASTPFNVAVGGTDFNDPFNPQTYWNTTNTSPTLESAKGYIPEVPWNDSCTNPVLSQAGFSSNAETRCNDPQLINGGLIWTVGASGGVSNCTVNSQRLGSCSGGYTKPSWQVGTLNDGKRDLPDVSFFASNGFMGNFYIYCQADAWGTCSTFNFGAAGGTSFGAPIFAAVMALVNQQQQTPEGQGNPNYILYKLASQQTASSCNSSTGPASTCVFNDVTSGTISMPCQNGSPNCTVNTAGHAYGVLGGYNTASGYDLATGLGTINVANLLSKWSSVTFRPTTTTLTLSPTSNLTHGQSVTVTGSVAPSSGSGTPTGSVSLLTSSGVSAGSLILTNGNLSGSTTLLPGGTYTVSAHYAGDTTFGGSDSAPVNITIGKESSTAQLQLETFDWQGRLISASASTAVYGSPYFLRMNVLNGSGVSCEGSNGLPQFSCPTGNITLTDNGSPLDAGTYLLNSLGYADDFAVQLPGGSNSVKAQYAGDNSFNASSLTATYSIGPAPTTAGYTAWNPGAATQQLQAQVYVQAQSTGAVPSGPVTFYVNGTAVPGTVTYNPYPNIGNNTVAVQAVFSSSSSPFPSPGTYTLSASYGGDQNYQALTIPGPSVTLKFPQTALWVQSSSYSVAAGATITLSATVIGYSKTIAPTGTITFRSSSGPTTAPVTYSTTTDPNTGDIDLVGTTTAVADFTDYWNATYSGDANFTSAQSVTARVDVAGADFTLSMQQSSVTIPRGSYAQIPMLIGMQASTVPVSFGANACSGLPAETTCAANFDNVPYTYSDLLNITTTAPHANSRPSGKTRAKGTTTFLPFALAACLLLPAASRRKLRVSASLLLLLLALACGGGSSSSGGAGGGGGGGGGNTDPGTPRGTYTVTVTATSGSFTHSATFTLTVQ